MPLFAPSQMLTVDVRVFIWNRFSRENYGDFNAEFQTHWVGIDVLEYILKKKKKKNLYSTSKVEIEPAEVAVGVDLSIKIKLRWKRWLRRLYYREELDTPAELKYVRADLNADIEHRVGSREHLKRRNCAEL